MKKLLILVGLSLFCLSSVLANERRDICINNMILSVTAEEKSEIEKSAFVHTFKLKHSERLLGDCSLLRSCNGEYGIVSPSTSQNYLISPKELVNVSYLFFDTDDWEEVNNLGTYENNCTIKYTYGYDNAGNIFVIIFEAHQINPLAHRC